MAVVMYSAIYMRVISPNMEKQKYFRMDDLAEQIRSVQGTPLPYEVDFAPDTSGRLSHLWSTPPQST